MPIDDITLENPFTDEIIDEGWAYCSYSAFDWMNKTARLVYDLYASRDAAYAGKPPLKTVEFHLTPEGKAAETRSVLVSAGTPAVYGEDDEGNPLLLSPAVDPVYTTEVVKPALPGLLALVAENAEAYADLTASVDELALTQPPFNGGTLEEVE